jgi:hypothetical protein
MANASASMTITDPATRLVAGIRSVSTVIASPTVATECAIPPAEGVRSASTVIACVMMTTIIVATPLAAKGRSVSTVTAFTSM